MKMLLPVLSQTPKKKKNIGSRIPKSDGFLHPLIQDCVRFLILIYYLTNLINGILNFSVTCII